MIRYRVKTEEEFITEYGSNWREGGTNNRTTVYFALPMDNYFGLEINIMDYDIYQLVGDKTIDLVSKKGESLKFHLDNKLHLIKHDSWSISMDMIKQISPEYNHKKVLVYD